MAQGEKRLKTVANAMRVLAELAEIGRPSQLGELSKRLGFSKSTTHLLLATLVDGGYVQQVDRNGRYKLGLGLVEVGLAAMSQQGLGSRLAPVMEALAVATQEAVSLSVLRDKYALIVQRFESTHVLRASIGVGTRMPPTTSASGRCILAFLPPDARTAALMLDREMTEKELKDLEDRFDRIREHGYEVQRDEWSPGISSLAAPVFEQDDRVIAALSISSPTVRFAPERWMDMLLSTAKELSTIARTTLASVNTL